MGAVGLVDMCTAKRKNNSHAYTTHCTHSQQQNADVNNYTLYEYVASKITTNILYE